MKLIKKKFISSDISKKRKKERKMVKCFNFEFRMPKMMSMTIAEERL